MPTKKEIKYIGIRVVPDVHAKLTYISRSEGRTINGQVYYLIQNCIRQYEKENGPITDQDLKDVLG